MNDSRGTGVRHSSVVARIGIPIVFGVAIELSSDLLKHVIHFIGTSVYGDVSLGIWKEALSGDLWLGTVIAVGLVCLTTWIMERWDRADPRRWVRIVLIVVSLVISGVLDPFSGQFRKQILDAYNAASIGEPMTRVIHRFQYYGDLSVQPNRDRVRHNELDCIDQCWLRLRYDVPTFFGEQDVILDFDQKEFLIRKCDVNDVCEPDHEPPQGLP